MKSIEESVVQRLTSISYRYDNYFYYKRSSSPLPPAPTPPPPPHTWLFSPFVCKYNLPSRDPFDPTTLALCEALSQFRPFTTSICLKRS